MKTIPLNKHSTKKGLRFLLRTAGILGILGILAVIGINLYVVNTTTDQILAPEAVPAGEWDCILVLGAGVRPDGSPSDMLYDRVQTGLDLYRAAAAPALLMSGDHGRTQYDEVGCMLDLALENGIPADDVFLDHARFSTYESLVRAREVFGVGKLVIVTQTYHLHRALYIAEALGMEAVGVPADLRTYGGQQMRDLREAAARVKDVFGVWLSVPPTCLGDPVDLSGDGTVTQE